MTAHVFSGLFFHRGRHQNHLVKRSKLSRIQAILEENWRCLKRFNSPRLHFVTARKHSGRFACKGPVFALNTPVSDGCFRREIRRLASLEERSEEVAPDSAIALLDHLHRRSAVLGETLQVGAFRERLRDKRVAGTVRRGDRVGSTNRGRSGGGSGPEGLRAPRAHRAGAPGAPVV